MSQFKKYDPARFPPASGFQHLINGSLLFMPDKTVVAYCASLTHPGFLTGDLIRQHRCMQRACPHLYTFPEHPFWKKQHRFAQKQLDDYIEKVMARDPSKDALLQERKAQRTEASQSQGVEMIRKAAEVWLKRHDLDENKFLIVDIRALGRSTKYYRMLYLTDKPVNDEARFAPLVQFIERRTQCVLRLTHVTDAQGYFATITEYLLKNTKDKERRYPL